jgi:hypothetical protein
MVNYQIGILFTPNRDLSKVSSFPILIKSRIDNCLQLNLVLGIFSFCLFLLFGTLPSLQFILKALLFFARVAFFSPRLGRRVGGRRRDSLICLYLQNCLKSRDNWRRFFRLNVSSLYSCLLFGFCKEKFKNILKLSLILFSPSLFAVLEFALLCVMYINVFG